VKAASRIRAALQTREAIAQTQGVTMRRDGVSALTASEVLHDTSRCTGGLVHNVAVQYVASVRDGAAPLAVPTGEGIDSGHAGREGGADPASGVAVPPTACVRSVPPTVDISPRQPDGTIYLTVGGDWTKAASGGIRSLFDGAYRHRPTLVIADLSEVGVMDTMSVDALAASARSLAVAGCRLELHNLPPHLGRLLQRTALGRVFPVADATPATLVRLPALAPTGRRATPQSDRNRAAAGQIASTGGSHRAPAG
jgi:anti-anti-sigma regulatory factor